MVDGCELTREDQCANHPLFVLLRRRSFRIIVAQRFAFTQRFCTHYPICNFQLLIVDGHVSNLPNNLKLYLVVTKAKWLSTPPVQWATKCEGLQWADDANWRTMPLWRTWCSAELKAFSYHDGQRSRGLCRSSTLRNAHALEKETPRGSSMSSLNDQIGSRP